VNYTQILAGESRKSEVFKKGKSNFGGFQKGVKEIEHMFYSFAIHTTPTTAPSDRPERPKFDR